MLGWFSPCMIKMHENLVSTALGVEVGLGQFCPRRNSRMHGYAGDLSSTSCSQDGYIPLCYFEKNSHVESFELHGFSDALEHAGICHCGLSAYMWFALTVTYKLLISPQRLRYSPNKKLTIHNSARALWCSSTYTTAGPR